MKINELQKPDQITQLQRGGNTGDWRYDASVILKQAGFKRVGFGSFGTVYRRDGDDKVLKIFGDDPAYLRWLAFCRANQSNLYVPQIRGKPTKIKDGVYGIRMEPLVKASDPTLAYLIGGLAQHYDALVVRGVQNEEIPNDAAPWLRNAKQYFRMAKEPLQRFIPNWQTDEDLKAILKFLNANANAVDLGNAENVMQRSDGHIVITDPMAD